jgi:hypothetical protein
MPDQIDFSQLELLGLPTLMAGKLDQAQVQPFLQSQDLDRQVNQPFFYIYKEINTQGGAYIEGDVYTGGGVFIGRDQTTTVS